ncbi:MAG: PBP1A family penicillin-binding protein, partial [Proteobacteria bacterium]|nr:PBP1A family penicillin-binding protein [Pseudomonadota bacterium]
WTAIALALLVGWYAADLPRLIDSPQFERQAAINIQAADGTKIGRYGDIKGISVNVSELPPHLVYAVLATEDRRFYQHFGVDPVGIMRAMAANARAGKFVQGGSTITQQLAKNLFLSRERTIKRKIQEALLALWLERKLTKDEILSAYLNRVYLGSGAYGIDAASNVYFNKSAKDVSLRESALLAGLLKAPSRYSPASNPGLAAKRARTVLTAMADAGYITEEEAKRESLGTPKPQKKPTEAGAIKYFTDWIVAEMDRMVGTTGKDMNVQTTLDPYLQEAAERAVSAALRERGEESHASQAAIVLLDYTGAIRAMVGGKNYDASQFNRAVQALRQPGSSFKPFVYLTALQQGWRKTDTIDDSPIRTGRYKPENYNGEYFGEVDLEFALAKSLNSATVRLAQNVGIDSVINTAHTLGISSNLQRDMSLSLGSSVVTLLEMAGAYATIGNNGRRVIPYAVTKITDQDGRLIYQRNNIIVEGRQLFDPRVIEQMDDMLRSVVEYGTGRGASVPFHAAGKTGTSQDFRDAWFVGYTDRYIAAVWVGNDDNSSMRHITGGSIPARIWRDIMLAAHEKGKEGAKASLFPVSSAFMDNDGGFDGMVRRLLGRYNE